MKTVSIYWWVLVIMITACLGSCEAEDENVLTTAEKQLVDSIYRRDIAYVRKRADSICDANYTVYMEYFVDSLKQVYLEGIDDIEAYLKQKDL